MVVAVGYNLDDLRVPADYILKNSNSEFFDLFIYRIYVFSIQWLSESHVHTPLDILIG